MKTLLSKTKDVLFEKRDGEYIPANYTILEVKRENDKAVVTTALYQIKSGAICTSKVGEKKHYFKKNKYGNLQRYAVKNVIY